MTRPIYVGPFLHRVYLPEGERRIARFFAIFTPPYTYLVTFSTSQKLGKDCGASVISDETEKTTPPMCIHISNPWQRRADLVCRNSEPDGSAGTPAAWARPKATELSCALGGIYWP